MSITIPLFRIASLIEKEEWKSFCSSPDKSDRRMLDDMIAISHLYNSAATYSAKDVSYIQFLCTLSLPSS